MKLKINNNSLPNIIFKQMPLELDTEIFYDFLNTNWSNRITKKYPEFFAINELKPKDEKLKAIKAEISKIRGLSEQKMSDGLKNIQSDWQKVGKDIIQTLSDIIQEEWPEREITAYISLNPICPRFLNALSFSVCPDNKNINKTITHELSHFLYFKRFKKILPDISQKMYESPHKEWILSELVAVIILDDPRISKIIGKEGNDFYDSHKNLKIDDQFVTEIIKDIYNEFVINNKDFSTFIKKSMEIIIKINYV